MSASMLAQHALRLIVSNVPVEHGDAVARALVTERLAACVNILPLIQSVYIWDGEVLEDEESCLLIKTTSDVRARCIARLLELHPYSTPEILEFEPDKVHELYAAWASKVLDPSLESDQ